MATAPKATYKVVYNGVNITGDISRHLTSLEYHDKVAGEPDEVSISLDDADGRWRNEWYPQKGDTIDAEITVGGQTLPCGRFIIDEIKLSGPPDVLTIKAVSAPSSKKIRTKKSKAREQVTLSQLANEIARAHGFSLVGSIDAIAISRTTQHREHDLAYLSRVAAEYGYVFNVKGTQMVFTNVYSLEGADVVFTLDRTDLMGYDVTDKIGATFAAANVKYHNPSQGATIKANYNSQIIQNPDNVDFVQITAADTLEIHKRVENKQQANLVARAALHKHNSEQRECFIKIPGNILALSGNNFMLTGMGYVSGKYHIIESTHKVDKSGGYESDATVKGVAVTRKSNQVNKPAKTIAKPARGNAPVPFASEIVGYQKPGGGNSILF